MNYLITDHLVSTVAVTDAAGVLLEESRYMPFGGVRSDVGTITGTDKSFTGQKVLTDTGLLDYNARFYSSELGRFTQPDTIIPGVGNSQSWNRYSYGLNNPVRYMDPTGHMVSCGDGESGACGGDTIKYLEWEMKKSPSRYNELFRRWGFAASRLIDYRQRYEDFKLPVTKQDTLPTSDILNSITQLSEVINWQLQAPRSFTIAQSPDYALLGGYRIYGNMKAVVDNGSPISIGPTSSTMNGVSFGPTTISFQLAETSTAELFDSAIGTNIADIIPNGASPWGIDIHYSETIRQGNPNITGTIGFQYKVRPDNLSFATAPIAVFSLIGVLPAMPSFIEASKGDCPAFGC